MPDPLLAPRIWLAARGNDDPSDLALAGAVDEIEHRAKVDALIEGLAKGPEK
jgi:hypothetical protein